ncbi:hypothetical protein CYV15_08840 [Riemerella anatipestifer]|uniref:hypothetical protein n=1 Tax=Riemerella anatipestifer TaxID=34085 RepID=UPI000D13EE4B|nr:hypothetical protein [Riemerella anatipestifer]PST43572.1 hypothetical protein CYV15_08840 [Riemerella anatipestifer]
MPLNKERLKQKIKSAFLQEQNEEESWDSSVERLSDKIATAIVQEILELRVEVPEGIKVVTTGSASSQTGATTEIKIANLS